MIILDTNVVSALMRDQPDPAVVAWIDDQPEISVWTTAITVFETRTGLELLDETKRRDRLESAFEQFVTEDLRRRVLAFDSLAAKAAGSLLAQARRSGRSAEVRDVQIAGIALARRATLATGNTKHFSQFGVRLTNPWGPPRDGPR